MAGASQFLQKNLLDSMLRHSPSSAVSGSNASTTNILVASSTGFAKGHIVKGTTAGSYHLVTAVPDGTHVTVTPAFAAAPTTGNLECWAYQPNSVHVALFTANPTDSTFGTEVTGGDYVRKALSQAPGTWNAATSASPSLVDNVAAIEWLAVTWTGTVTGWALVDESTGTANIILWFDSTDIVVASGNNVRFAAGTLDLTVD